MSLDDVKKRVAEIAAMVGDNEAAHGAEDELWADVLTAIADGNVNAQDLAGEALKTSGIEFERWYA